MKKLLKYAYVVLAGVLAMTATSCKDKYEYEGPGAQDPGAFLSVNATSLKYAADDDQILKVTLVRTNSEAAESISLTTDNSHFQVPSSVSFSAGESKKEVEIPFNILGGTTEEVTISVAEESATVYGISTVTFTITRDFVWDNLGDAVVTSWWWEETITLPIYRGQGTNKYQIRDYYVEGITLEFELTDDGQHLAAEIPATFSGYVHSSYGEVFWRNLGIANDIQREGNVIYLPLQWIVSAGSFGWGYETIELPE